jgi:hypothetical protein
VSELYQALPPEGIKIALVLFLAFLLGLEREERKSSAPEYAFGGVRTFPLIGMVGYAIASLSGGQPLPVTIGLAVVAGFLLLSYWHKLQTPGHAGATSEISALTIYLVGYLRLVVLVGLFNPRLLAMLGIPFVVLAAAALGTGWLWSRVPDGHATDVIPSSWG